MYFDRGEMRLREDHRLVRCEYLVYVGLVVLAGYGEQHAARMQIQQMLLELDEGAPWVGGAELDSRGSILADDASP